MVVMITILHFELQIKKHSEYTENNFDTVMYKCILEITL